MTNERTKDSGKSVASNEGTLELSSVYRSVSFWLLATVAIILLLREYRIYQSKGVVNVDTDISHAVEARLTAIEDRLDKIESGAAPKLFDGEQDEEEVDFGEVVGEETEQ